MFPNTFHREHILLKLKIKKLLRKIRSKNLSAGVFFFFFFFVFFFKYDFFKELVIRTQLVLVLFN